MSQRTLSIITTVVLSLFGGLQIIAAPEPTVRCLVFEHPDNWTDGATGACRLLREAGATVAVLDLDLDQSPTKFDADLVVFGSFANNDDRYATFTKAHAGELQSFVANGGVVLVMTQSDQFGTTEAFLPDGLEARRSDNDFDQVSTVVDDHPLLAGWAPDRGESLSLPSYRDNPHNWESFVEWRGFRILMASGPGHASPAFLEGSHGNGRVLLSSLWLDKIFDKEGKAIVPDAGVQAGRKFFEAVINYVDLVRAGSAPAVVPTPAPLQAPAGPMLGHIDTNQALIWYRPEKPGTFDLAVTQIASGNVSLHQGEAEQSHDLCITWRVAGLQPATDYSYVILSDGVEVVAGDQYQFQTAPLPDAAVRVSLALGSCASSTEHPGIWDRMAIEEIDGVVLLGDTPYINSSDEYVNRTKHREFLQFPALAKLGAGIPFWMSWDDHDFGGNDTDGNMPGKEIIRKVFTNYRALDHFGEADEGIYTRFRRGPFEVFLLDARYFAQTEPSPVDPDQPTCLGKRQWEWLLRHLAKSTATFKIIASGMIWDDKTNSEKDDWHTYKHERDALIDFIGKEKISGVILIGGDIHCCRALRYKSEERIGYPLWQFISSPLHDGIIESLNVPHPDLVFGAAAKNVFLKLTADATQQPVSLEAAFIRQDGERLFELQLDSQQLSPPR